MAGQPPTAMGHWMFVYMLFLWFLLPPSTPFPLFPLCAWVCQASNALAHTCASSVWWYHAPWPEPVPYIPINITHDKRFCIFTYTTWMVNFVWDQLVGTPFRHMDPVYGQWLVQGGLITLVTQLIFVTIGHALKVNYGKLVSWNIHCTYCP